MVFHQKPLTGNYLMGFCFQQTDITIALLNVACLWFATRILSVPLIVCGFRADTLDQICTSNYMVCRAITD